MGDKQRTRGRRRLFGIAEMGKFTGFLRRFESEVLYCRNPRRDGRRRNASATCDSPPFDARFRSSRRSTSPRPFAVGETGLPFFDPSVAAIVATCRLFRVDRRRAFAASFRRFDPRYPFIPNGLRFDLSTAFRRGASDSSRRRPDRRTSRVSSRASAFENVEKCLLTRQGACNSR